MKTPQEEGCYDAREGKLYFENPYPESMESHWQWLSGWTRYEEQYQKNKS